MFKTLIKTFSHQNFFPDWLNLFTNPFYIARAELCKTVTILSHNLNGQLLDVGCGTKPYISLFSNINSYIGLDIDSETTRQLGVADYFYDGKIFPFTDEKFDSILCNQVLEHVFNPDEFLSEIVRVLKPGGKLLLTVPFVWDEHEQPNDYARYSTFGLKALLEKQGFRIIQHKKLAADASMLFQMINAYYYKITLSLPKYIKLPLSMIIIPTINLSGVVARHLFPDNPDLFLDHAVLAEKTA